MLSDITEIKQLFFQKSASKMRKLLIEIPKSHKKNAPRACENFWTYLLLNRNLDTIKHADSLFQKCSYDDGFTLLRLAIERISFAYVVIAESSSLEDIEKMTSNQAFSRLKRRFPKLGPVYGLASKLAHSEPNLAVVFGAHIPRLKLFKKTEKPKLIRLNLVFQGFLVILMELNMLVTNLLLNDYQPKEKSFTKPNNEDFSLGASFHILNLILYPQKKETNESRHSRPRIDRRTNANKWKKQNPSPPSSK